MLEFKKPLPKYRCHKVVGALTIKSITTEQKARWVTLFVIDFEEEGYGPIKMPDEWFRKHHPVVGGKLVQYEGGYVSFSPIREFVDGYTAIESENTIFQEGTEIKQIEG